MPIRAGGRTAGERIRQRLVAWIERHKHGSQTELLRRIREWCHETRGHSWLSDIKLGRAALVVDDIDLIATAMEVPPGELIRRDDDHYMELTRAEAALVVWFRTQTSDSQRYFLDWLRATFDPGNISVARPMVIEAHWIPAATPLSTGGSSSHVVVGQEGAPATNPSREQIDQLITDTLTSLHYLQHLRDAADRAPAGPTLNAAPQRSTNGRGDATHPPRRPRTKART